MTTLRCFALASFSFTVAVAYAADAPAALPAPPPMAPASVAKPAPEPTIELSNPRGIAVDKNGVVYIGDIGNGAVYKLTPDGKIALLAGGASASSSVDGVGKEAGFSTPTGLAVDKDGNVYVADGDNNTIRKITPSGKVTTLAGKAGDSGPADGKGDAARFTGATAVAVDKDGNVYVADTHNGSIRKITPDGVVTTLGAKPAPKPTDAKDTAVHLSAPRAITLDSAGVIYVADEDLGIVCKVAADGAVTVIAGDPASTSGSKDGVGTKATISAPRGLVVDSKGNLYVASTDEAIIRKITPDGTVTTLAGKSGDGGLVDGKGAAAHFSGPRGLAADKDGNIYVADSENAAIRKVAPDGTVTTLVPAKK